MADTPPLDTASRRRFLGFWCSWVAAALAACIFAAGASYLLMLREFSAENSGYQTPAATPPYFGWVVLWWLMGPLAVGLGHSFLLRHRVRRWWAWTFTMLAWIPFFFLIVTFSGIGDALRKDHAPIVPGGSIDQSDFVTSVETIVSTITLQAAADAAMFALIGGLIFAFLQQRLLHDQVRYFRYAMATAAGVFFGLLLGLPISATVVAAFRLLAHEHLIQPDFYLALYVLGLCSIVIIGTAVAQGRIIAGAIAAPPDRMPLSLR